MRRIVFATLTVVAFIVSVAVPVAAESPSSVVDATCGVEGRFQINPGVTATAQSQQFALEPSHSAVFTVPAGSCPLAPEPQLGSLSGTFTSVSAQCLPTTDDIAGQPAMGTLKITWNDASTSKARVRLRWATKRPMGPITVAGKVLSGTYAGDSVRGRLVWGLVPPSLCADGHSISEIGFGSGGKRDSTLTFEHA